MTTKTTNTYTVDLQLDNDEDQPRRLTRIGENWIAYGGDDGTISLLRSSAEGIWAQTIRRMPEDGVRAIAVSDDGTRVALGLDSGSTLVYVYDDYRVGHPHPFCQPRGDQDNLLSQADQPDDGVTIWNGPCFDAPLRDLVFEPNTHRLAMACESGLAVVDATNEESLQATKLLQEEADQAHDASGIRSLAWKQCTPGQCVLVSIAMDGRACLWDTQRMALLHRDDTKCISKADPGEILGADPYDRSCRPIWMDNVLFLPGESYLQARRVVDGQVQSIDQANGEGHSGTIVAFAQRDDFLLTTARDGRIICWQKPKHGGESTWTLVQEVCRLESPATDIAWVNDDTLYAACADGKLFVQRGDRSKIAPPTKQSVVAQPVANIAEARAMGNAFRAPTNDYFDNDSVGSQSKSDEPINSTQRNPFVDDEAEDDESMTGNNTNTPEQVKDDASVPQNNDDDDDDDDESTSVEPTTSYYTRPQRLELPEPQAAFAPSSTPLDLARRFMCWNYVGSVVYHMGAGSERSTVDIDFTDSGFRRPISFTDNMGFILGTLGRDGAMFATALDDEEEEDDDLGIVDELISDKTKALVKKSAQFRSRMKPGSRPRGSTLYFHRFDTVGSVREKDWYLTLPSGELVLGCASGDGWAAAITSRRFLRLFSSGGNQGKIFWLKGEPVSIVGRERLVAVFYHEGMPLMDGTQKLGYQLFDAKVGHTIAEGSVSCISSSSSLTWTGFDNDGSLIAMDSDGMVSMLVCTSDDAMIWAWMPMLDTVGLRKSSDDSFWPITIHDGKLVCVPLKGGTKYPDATRKPVTTALGLRMPFARGNLAAVHVLEEISVRADIALGQKKAIHDATEGTDDEQFDEMYMTLSAKVDKVTLKMFAAAVEGNKLDRAMDLVERLHLEKSHDLAIALADSHRKLIESIENIKDRKFGAPTYDDTPEEDYGEEMHSSVTPDANESKKRSFDELPDSSLGNARLIRRKQAFT